MIPTTLARTVLAAVLVVILPALPARSQVPKTFVSIAGSDINSCTLTSPCASLQRAVDMALGDGVVSCLDSKDYSGPVTISKNVTIDCGGTTATGGPFTINGVAITAYIKNISILNTMASGITFVTGTALYVDNVHIALVGTGISVTPSSPATIVVSNSVLKSNLAGVVIKPVMGASVTASFDHLIIGNNTGGGLKTDTTGSGGPVTVDVSNSTIMQNAGNGVNAVGTSVPIMVSLSHNVIAANGGAGVQANGVTAAALLDTTLLDSNATGALSAINGSRLISYGTNRIVGPAGSGFTGQVPRQ